MTQSYVRGTRLVPSYPESVCKDKDKIIRAQVVRIEQLERAVEQLRKERDGLSTKVALLSYKLESTSQSLAQHKQTMSVISCGSSEGATGHGGTAPSTLCPVHHQQYGSGLDVSRSPPSTSSTPLHQRCLGGRPQRTSRTHKREEDDRLKRSRAWANAYELSQDLHEKQLEMLERKYGGHLRTRRAARIIQQAYRHYRLNKNFEKLRYEVEDKRLRRLSEFGRSKSIWTDMVASIEESANLRAQFFNTDSSLFNQRHQSAVSYSDHFQQKTLHTTSSSTSTSHSVRVIHKSHSLNVMTKEGLSSKEQRLGLGLEDRRSAHSPAGLDLSTILENSRVGKALPARSTAIAIPVPSESNNNRDSYPELNDSSGSASPQEQAIEPTVDLPSINFEKLLESKETDILNDSFHSDSSQDGPQHSPRTSQIRYSHTQDVTDGYCDMDSEQNDTLKADRSHASDRTSNGVSGIEILVEKAMGDSTNTLMTSSLNEDDGTLTPDDANTYTKIYANTEVRLRKLKDGSGSPEISPIWKRKSAQLGALPKPAVLDETKRMSNVSEVSEPESVDSRGSMEGFCSSPSSDTCSMSSDGAGHTYHRTLPTIKDHQQLGLLTQPPPPRLSDRQRKRMYRIGLNLFNKKPEKGVRYLMENRFLENRPQTIAKFLISRKGLSKQMIGDYLGNIQKQFNMEVLSCFCHDIDLAGLQVDMALRKFQSYFRMPGEAQKIERLMEAFASRYCDCNPDQAKMFSNMDTVFLLAFAIIMLNTDLHNKNIKAERKMKLTDFIKNLKGIDGGEDLDPDLLQGIYDRIRATEFKPGSDHVLQVMKVEQMIAGKKPPLSLPHRRLVCYCRLYEVVDPNKKEKLGLHQREVFLFNDVLMVTKIFTKKKNSVTYSFRQSFPLCGMVVYLFQTPYYKHGIRLTTNINGKVLITFNARNEHDQSKFVEDLKEAILEINEMETLRIEEELQKQKMTQSHKNFNRHSKDSGVVDIELLKPTDPTFNRLSAPECGGLKKAALSNSLIDLSEGSSRRGSGGSLDSGMVSAGSGSQEDNHAAAAAAVIAAAAVASSLAPIVNPGAALPPSIVPTGQPPHNPKTMKSHSSSSSKFGLFGRKNKGSKASLGEGSEV